ncbi:sensor histidine kinase [Stigmatella aurantiaca]|nr:PAS domain-containing protein [Stigmatella aurantiaca]ADO69962.1 Sensor protein [Stigmatella aurantiaca DW4/3-1]
MSRDGASRSALSAFVEGRRADILQRWTSRVRGGLDQVLVPRKFLDTLPEVFDAWLSTLVGWRGHLTLDASLDAISAIQRHGRQCFQLGLGIEELVRDHQLLREAVFELMEETHQRPGFAELRVLTGTLDATLAEALRQYTQTHEQAMRVSSDQRVQLEREEARRNLRELVDLLPIVFWSFDAQGIFTLSKGSGLAAVGLISDEAVGQSLYTLYGDRPEVLSAVARALNGERLSVEVKLGEAWFDMRFQPQFGPDGQVTEVLGLSLDITERRLTQEALQKTEMRYQLATLATRDTIWDWDLQAQSIHWSDNVHRLTGYPPAEMEHTFAWWGQRMHPEDKVVVERTLKEALEGEGEHWACEYRFMHKDGSYIILEDRGYVVRDEKGKALRMVGALEDITERRLAEERARRRAEFEQYLIGIVSHDLRNPLNAITLAATLLIKRDSTDANQQQVLNRILFSARRANRMLRDLLDFTQARLSGGIPLKPQPLDLHGFARQILEEVQLAYPGRRLLVEHRGDGKGEWDADRLAQVITNLMNNALTYSPNHCPVQVRTRGERDSVVISIHNDGEPIPAEVLPKLFQPLKRGPHKGGKSQGSIGLGLFIVKHIVEAHGGSISVHSTAANGTTFLARLPRYTSFSSERSSGSEEATPNTSRH